MLLFFNGMIGTRFILECCGRLSLILLYRSVTRSGARLYRVYLRKVRAQLLEPPLDLLDLDKLHAD